MVVLSIKKYYFDKFILNFTLLYQVERVINEMGLRHVAESRIGGAVIRGISGGEKRRVTIAIQLLQDPGKLSAAFVIIKERDVAPW